MFYFVCILALFIAFVTTAAFRAEHLVVLHWEKAGTFLLEHVRGGRYELIPPAAAPLALARFVRRRTLYATISIRRRAGGWMHGHRPHAIGMKV
jgi:hypothetical protein